MNASIGFVGRTKLPEPSLLGALYEWPEMRRFMSDVIRNDRDGANGLYLSGDDNGSVYATVNTDDDETVRPHLI